MGYVKYGLAKKKKKNHRQQRKSRDAPATKFD